MPGAMNHRCKNDIYFCFLQRKQRNVLVNPFEFSNTFLCTRFVISELNLIETKAQLNKFGLIDFKDKSLNLIRLFTPFYT